MSVTDLGVVRASQRAYEDWKGVYGDPFPISYEKHQQSVAPRRTGGARSYHNSKLKYFIRLNQSFSTKAQG